MTSIPAHAGFEPTRPYLWERNYPAGVRWDAAIETSTVTALFDASATRFADAPALTFMGHTLSYRQFADHVDRMATALKREGVTKDTPVALFLPNTPWHPIFFFAVLSVAGASFMCRRSMPNARSCTS